MGTIRTETGVVLMRDDDRPSWESGDWRWRIIEGDATYTVEDMVEGAWLDADTLTEAVAWIDERNADTLRELGMPVPDREAAIDCWWCDGTGKRTDVIEAVIVGLGNECPVCDGIGVMSLEEWDADTERTAS